MSSQPPAFTFHRYASVFASPQGLGDARPTALQIVKDEGLVDGLSDKTILVTGASTGIGTETARALAATGARLILCVRNVDKGRAAIETIATSFPTARDRINVVRMDNADLASVREAATEIQSMTDKINVLVFNAGVGGTPYTTTKDGYELALQTNHISHFLLFQLLKKQLLAGASPEFASRVVIVTSLAHRFSTFHFDDPNFTKDYDPGQSYGSSKTACQWTSNEIERRYGAQGIHSVSVHPGAVGGTNFAAGQDPEFAASVMGIFKADAGLMASIMSPEQGSATTILAAIGREFEGQGGLYLEDCQTSAPFNPEGARFLTPGYAPHAFDEASERKLWKRTCEWVNIEDE